MSISAFKTINANVRTSFGSSEAKKNRKNGLAMASIYENGKSTHITFDYIEGRKMIENDSIKTKIIEFSIDGKKVKTIVKKFHFCPVSSSLEYVEFTSLEGKKEVETLIPIKIIGSSSCPGLKRSGKINIIKYEVPAKVSIKNEIPEELVIDISKFGLGKVFSSKDIDLEGVSFSSDFPILSIIGRGKKDEEVEESKSAS